MHADFDKHSQTKLDRRINVLVYLNKNWHEGFGGHFELWDREMKTCVKKVLPAFNTLAIFSTTDFSYHGHPSPLTCPPDRSRRSLALYYYSNGRPSYEMNNGPEEHRTLFVARNNDSSDRSMRHFNRLTNFITDVTPPLLLRYMKRVLIRR
ncbi:MAG: 2OG-Fe(II) oxygenase [Pseudomonadota bacterium]